MKKETWAANEWFYTKKTNSKEIKPSSPWIPPPSNLLKINLDASFDHITKTAGLAGVCRNDAGDWIKGFTWKSYYSSALEAELHAIRIGYHWVIDNDWLQ